MSSYSLATTSCAGSTAVWTMASTTGAVVGDYIYVEEDCSCGEQPVDGTYYSNKCGGRSGNCFTVDGNCQVDSIAGCGR